MPAEADTLHHKVKSGRRSSVDSPEGSRWVFVLLAVLTLLPAACVLWFMNDALARESASARQRVLESYRGQLRLVRSRLDPIWRAQAKRLSATDKPELRFQRLIVSEIAEGALILGDDGAVLYPDRRPPDARRVAAVAQQIADTAALPPGERRPAADRIALRLNDYATSIPAPERLMLMDRLREVAPNVQIPTQAALRLSMEMLDAERPAAVPDVVRQTAMPDIWALTSEDNHVIAFYRTGRLEAMMHDFLHQVAPAGIVFIATPPDIRADSEAIAAGSWLPGWQLSFVPLDDSPFDTDVSQRRTVYISVALAGVALMAVIGVAVAGTVRRHLRLARMKADMVAAVSHELRTPLASMRVLVDGLLADKELDASKTREYLEMMAVENSRLSRLIENFLAFARLERQRQPFAVGPVSPASVVAASVEAVRDRMPEGCDLRLDVQGDLPPVMADAEALTTALVNLLDNALKYTRADKHITVRARRDGDAIAFEVTDDGIGIPLREQRRIFRRFYRVDQRLTRETTGVGLGLSIVEAIVRGHGGTIGVKSEPGEGSTFTFRVPSAPGGTV